MKHTTISMLTPELGRCPAYDRFYRTYSMLVATNVVTHHLIHQVSEAHLADLLLCEVVEGAKSDYVRARTLYSAMGLSFEAVQMGEDRGLDLTDVSQSLAEGRATAKQIILAFQNFNEFVILFALFEDAVKDLLSPTDGGSAVKLKEPKVMEDLLTYLQGLALFKRFKAELEARTICEDYEDAKRLWTYFVALRHLYVHSGGRPTSKWMTDYKGVRDAVVSRLESPDIGTMDVREIIEEEIEPRERVLLMLPDGLVNIFRNFVVGVMEAVYVSGLPRTA